MRVSGAFGSRNAPDYHDGKVNARGNSSSVMRLDLDIAGRLNLAAGHVDLNPRSPSMTTSSSALSAWWQRFICRMSEARRLRREMNQLAYMSARELRDIGFSHPSMALAAAAEMPSRCR
jgi:uncharacterized protein YjiS (DUF1127 family)